MLEYSWTHDGLHLRPPPGSPATAGPRGQSAELGSSCHSVPEERAGLSSTRVLCFRTGSPERSPRPQFPWPRRKADPRAACSHSPAGAVRGLGRPAGTSLCWSWGGSLLLLSCPPEGACSGPWSLGTSYLPPSSQAAEAAMPMKAALWVALVGTNGQRPRAPEVGGRPPSPLAWQRLEEREWTLGSACIGKWAQSEPGSHTPNSRPRGRPSGRGVADLQASGQGWGWEESLAGKRHHSSRVRAASLPRTHPPPTPTPPPHLSPPPPPLPHSIPSPSPAPQPPPPLT